MAIALHPWVIGPPHRIGALDCALEHIASKPGVLGATGDELSRRGRPRSVRLKEREGSP